MIGKKICGALACALIGTTLLQACAASGTRNATSKQDDANITAQVKAAIGSHADLGPPNQIYVDTRSRVVYLTGTVADSLAGKNATAVARGVPGVDSVVNDIAVDK
jgi:osmotically-inducible protein OsmY